MGNRGLGAFAPLSEALGPIALGDHDRECSVKPRREARIEIEFGRQLVIGDLEDDCRILGGDSGRHVTAVQQRDLAHHIPPGQVFLALAVFGGQLELTIQDEVQRRGGGAGAHDQLPGLDDPAPAMTEQPVDFCVRERPEDVGDASQAEASSQITG